ncbi:MAG: OAM dimerization domain-containing protein, partial [Mesotoga sp.]|nr:OAM dimerization domain-containing protein [Mesotoga sp.]
EEILEVGGYFEAVEKGFFVDNGQYPERNGDGIARQKNGGIGAGSVVPRDPEYFAPVSEHFGYNNIPEGFSSPDEPIGGCTLQDRSKIKYIDELDESDNVNLRISQQLLDREKGLISPEVEWWGDGWIQLDMTIPDDPDHSEAAALEIAKRMGFTDASVISKTVLHPVEGTYLELKAKVPFKIERDSLKLPEKPDLLSEEEITSFVQEHPMRVVAGTVGNDEHSVGIREILDIKHGGIEKFGFKYTYLGTSVSPEKFIDAAVETGAEAILVSTIITHNEVHVSNMTKIAQLAVEKGVRNKVIIISGGTQITNDLAVACGMDAGFGRGTKGINVASFLVKKKRALLG